jgi:hypothetical protein
VKIILILITLIIMAFGGFMAYLVMAGLITWWTALLAVAVILVAIFYGGPKVMEISERDHDGR